MLRFFQKYQRFFFLLVTGVTIASFAFFGVFDTFNGTSSGPEDRVVSRAVDGSKIMASELSAMTRFIGSDVSDIGGGFRGVPNLCNDGVLRRDLLQTGLAEMVVAEYFDVCQKSFAHRLEKAKRYRGYEHAHSPTISIKAVWDKLMPPMSASLDALQHQSHATIATFTELARLYQMQAACPPEFVRRVLLYDEKQQTWLEKDPALQYVDLSFMGFHSLSDWFGGECVDLFAQFILNGARFAESKGYTVSSEEAKADLMRNFQTSLEHLSHVPGINSLTFTSHLNTLGLDEKSAVQTWRSILLFRRYFQGIGESVFLDSLPYRQFTAFTRETALIDKYEWPSAIRLKTFEDLLEFQLYLKGVGGKLTQVSLPSAVLPLQTIVKTMPDLVHTTYQMKVARVTEEEAGLYATAREILDWQLDLSNFNKLCQTFAFLEPLQAKEERLRALDLLSVQQRMKVDQLARRELVKQHPEWFQQCFKGAKKEDVTVSVSENWVSLQGIKNVAQFRSFLTDSLGEEYSEDSSVVYHFSDKEQTQAAHVLTFGEAKELGVMAFLVDRFLEGEYGKIREKYPQFRVSGGWKIFSSVKEEVGQIVLSELLHAIGPENKPLAYYALHRLEIPAKEALFSLQYGAEESGEDPLLCQFRLEKKQVAVPKKAKDVWMQEQLKTMDVGQWSMVQTPEDGNVSFFYFRSHEHPQESIEEFLSMGKEKIGADAQRYAALAFLALAKQKHAIFQNKDVK